MNKKKFRIEAMTQRRYLLKVEGIFSSPEEARKAAYNYIIDHAEEVGFKPSLYIKIEVKEIKENV